MHPDAYHFVARATAGHDFTRKTVVELGSYNVNGTVRGLFAGANYIGVDVRAGPDVDVVEKAERYVPEKPVDVVVTTEMLEHHPKPQSVVTQAAKMLKPGGLLIITAASPERAPHGVDGGAVGDEHYGNISPEDLQAWLKDWDDVLIERNERAGDVYALATRAKD